MYRLYIDETGNADLDASVNPDHRFLSLTGVLANIEHCRNVATPGLNAIKDNILQRDPDEPMVLHRKDIVNRKRPFQILRDEIIAAEFDAALLRYLQDCEYIVFTAIIDKLEHLRRYRVWRYDPYHYCLEVLIERYVLWLRRNRQRGDVMGEIRGGRPDRRLEKVFRYLYKHGTSYVDKDLIQSRLTSGNIKLKPKSANITGLQIADLLAHPSAQYLRLQNVRNVRLGAYAQKIAQILIGQKYNRSPHGNIIGWGTKWLP